MQRLRCFIALCAFLLAVSPGCTYQPPAPAEPSGRRLRAIVADKYKDGSIIIGATTGSWAFGTRTGEILDREFSYVTPENDFKQHEIHPDNNRWNWKQADAWVEHIKAHGQILRIHGPIGPQCSHWAQDDQRTGAELEKNMTDFLTALCHRYNGKPGFVYLDVVNETVVQNGEWHTNKTGIPGWECPWYKIGPWVDPNCPKDINGSPLPKYIIKAFQIANEHAPDLKFIFNHHENPEAKDSWDLIMKTVEYLRSEPLGLRVDGLGWQAHVDAGWETIPGNIAALRSLIDWAHGHDLEFHVTEASVWLPDREPTPADLAKQAYTYRAIVEVLLEKRFTGKVGWNTWHIDDGTGWNTQLHPSLFDREFQPKPAYYAVQAALEEGAGRATSSPGARMADGLSYFK